MFELTEHEGGIHDVGERETPVPAWPSCRLPMVVGARHQIDGIEPVRVCATGRGSKPSSTCAVASVP